MKDIVRIMSDVVDLVTGIVFVTWSGLIWVGWSDPLSAKWLSIVVLIGASAALGASVRARQAA